MKKVSPRYVSTEYGKHSSFGGRQSSMQTNNVYFFGVKGTRSGIETVVASEIPNICRSIHRPSIDGSKLKCFNGLPLAESGSSNNNSVEIGNLIGLDKY